MLGRAIAYDEGPLAPIFDISALKSRDRDALEQALRTTVKRSLQELSRAINGDAKTEPQTLFGVKIVLENNRVDYRPTMINLTHVVNVLAVAASHVGV